MGSAHLQKAFSFGAPNAFSPEKRGFIHFHLKEFSMKKTTIACGLAIVLAASTGAVLAQYTGPSSQPAATTANSAAPGAAYTGPSSVPVTTVKQLLASASDDQHARLQGRIVSHDGGKNYTFADDTGRMPVEISAKRFPPSQPIGADQRVEIAGEVDKDLRKMEFEVDSVRLMP